MTRAQSPHTALLPGSEKVQAQEAGTQRSPIEMREAGTQRSPVEVGEAAEDPVTRL